MTEAEMVEAAEIIESVHGPIARAFEFCGIMLTKDQAIRVVADRIKSMRENQSARMDSVSKEGESAGNEADSMRSAGKRFSEHSDL